MRTNWCKPAALRATPPAKERNVKQLRIIETNKGYINLAYGIKVKKPDAPGEGDGAIIGYRICLFRTNWPIGPV